MVLEQHPRRVGLDLVADERLLFLDDLAHARFDPRQIVFLEVLAARQLEVVVEAVFDGRADAERGTGYRSSTAWARTCAVECRIV